MDFIQHQRIKCQLLKINHFSISKRFFLFTFNTLILQALIRVNFKTVTAFGSDKIGTQKNKDKKKLY